MNTLRITFAASLLLLTLLVSCSGHHGLDHSQTIELHEQLTTMYGELESIITCIIRENRPLNQTEIAALAELKDRLYSIHYHIERQTGDSREELSRLLRILEALVEALL